MNGPLRIRLAAAGLVLLSIVMLAAACQRKPAELPPASGTPADSAQQAHLAEGQKIFVANCSMCHGEWGLGDGPLATQIEKQTGIAPTHLNRRTLLDSLGRQTIVNVIERGGDHTGRSNLMPAWGERLPAEDIETVADFVMALPDLHREVPSSVMAKFLAAPPGASAEGRKLFLAMCSACHGPHGKGDGRFADSLYARNKIRPRDLTDSVYFGRKTDQDLYAAISLGGGFFHKSPFMPIWGVSLSPDQIRDLVSYLRVVSRTASRT